jgi:hypothetical protein
VRSRSLTIEQVLSLLAETPPRIAALTADLSPAQLHTTPNHDGWSANDVLAHLRACADVWGNCIVAMIEEDWPVLRAVNPRTWIKKTDYLELEFRPSLRSFATQRADLLAVLSPLPIDAWSRAARVSGRERYSSGPCCSLRSGWLAMNGSTSSRSNASSTRCSCSNGRPCPGTVLRGCVKRPQELL